MDDEEEEVLVGSGKVKNSPKNNKENLRESEKTKHIE